MKGTGPREIGEMEISEGRTPPRKSGGGFLPWALLVLGAAAWLAFMVLYVLPQREELQAAQNKLTQTQGDKEALQAQITELQKARGDLESSRTELERSLKEKEDEIKSLTATQEELNTKLQDEVKKGEVAIKRLHGELVVDLVDKVLFDSGDAELSERGKEVLKKVADSLRKLEDKVLEVGGHTDAMPISPKLTNRFASNWELSGARATNVVRFLQEACQIPGERLVSAGFAEFRPIAKNQSKTGRQRNRRIEVKLVQRRDMKG